MDCYCASSNGIARNHHLLNIIRSVKVKTVCVFENSGTKKLVATSLFQHIYVQRLALTSVLSICGAERIRFRIFYQVLVFMPTPPLPEGCGLPGLRGKFQLIQWKASVYCVRLSEGLALALAPIEHFQVLALSLGSSIPWPDKYRTIGDVLKRQVVFDHFLTTNTGDRIRSFFPPLVTVSGICGTIWV